MSSLMSSTQDKRELERHTRVLALKVAQIIVQSRTGEKVKSECKPKSSGTDWFNLAIQDSPEILAETKRSLREELFTSSIPLCIEISVKTAENQSNVLEVWSIRVRSDKIDPIVKLTNTMVYNRMGTLLRSLLVASRMTPAYKISRRQNPESYVICYRIFMGEPQLYYLGDDSKHMRVGQLNTIIGAIQLSVSYRTKVTFSPAKKCPDSISLKSDHFEDDSSPTNTRKEETLKLPSEKVKVGAFVGNRITPVNEMTDVPFGSLLSRHRSISDPGANVPLDESPTDTCDSNKLSSNNEVTKSGGSSANNDFIMVDVKSPFAMSNTKVDLGTFYRECQNAPSLHTFAGDMTLEEQIGDLTKQLENFETNMRVYDNFVDTLCKLDKNND